MKFLIETGPVVDGEDTGMLLSYKHHRRLGDILLDWYRTLPSAARLRVASLQAAPSRRLYPSIRVDVTLTGEYHRRGGEPEADEKRTWKSSFYSSFPYRPQYGTDNHYKPNCFEPELSKRLTDGLLEDLRKEEESHQSAHQDISTVIAAVKKKKNITT